MINQGSINFNHAQYTAITPRSHRDHTAITPRWGLMYLYIIPDSSHCLGNSFNIINDVIIRGTTFIFSCRLYLQCLQHSQVHLTQIWKHIMEFNPSDILCHLDVSKRVLNGTPHYRFAE